MADRETILLYFADRPVLSSLQFSLTVEGFQVADGTAGGVDPATAGALVIDQNYQQEGVANLRTMRRNGCRTPAILAATNPSSRLRATAATLGAQLIEKPLLGDELTSALHRALDMREAA